jgi:trk system potassium uptake protein TrkA
LPGDEVFVIGKTGVPSEVGWLAGKNDQAAKNVVILGGGSTGQLLAKSLEQHRKQIPSIRIIERDRSRCEELAECLHHVMVVHGDGARPHLLQEENIQDADAFICVTGQEQTNLLAGYMAKQAGVGRVIALLNRQDYVPVATAMGIDATVTPRVVVAGTILRLLHKTNVKSLSLLKEGSLEVLEIVVTPKCKVRGRPLRALGLPGGAIVGAVIRGDTVVVPRGDTVLGADDHVVVFATPSVVPALDEYFKEI